MLKFSKVWKSALFVLFVGSITGCAELNELRGLNKRQSVTIRDQADNIARLDEDNNKLKEKLLADELEKKRLHAELEKLARAIGEGAVVRDTIEGPVIQLQEKILFDSGMAEIKPSGESALLTIANYLKERPDALLRIDGHTDSDPIVKTKHIWDSNHHLSAARSLAVFHFLTKKQDLDQLRVHISGFGPNRPVSKDEDKEGKRKNRRVEFLIVKGSEFEQMSNISSEE